MYARVSWLIAVLLIWVTALSVPAHAACKRPGITTKESKTIPVEKIDQALLSKAIAKQTNYFRCLKGLQPLQHDTRLVKAAEMHSRNMAKRKELSHDLPVAARRTVADRFKAARVEVKKIRAENIGADFRYMFQRRVFHTVDASECRFRYADTRSEIPAHSYGSMAQSIVVNWWNSPKHRANMLNKRIKRIGSAAHFTVDHLAPCGTYYFTQDFAG